MTSTAYPIPMAYTYNPNHKGAPYTLDGSNYMNRGQLAECLLKACKGYKPESDNLAFDIASDIAETCTSVKSGKASLCGNIADSFAETLALYFDRVHSTNWSFVVIGEDSLQEFNMGADEFKSFVNRWGFWDKDSNKVRLNKESTQMLKWLSKRVK